MIGLTTARFTFIIAVAAILPKVATGQSGATSRSESVFDSREHELEFKFGGGRQHTRWFLVGIRPKGQLGGPQSLELWKVDDKGTKLATVNVEDSLRRAGVPGIFRYYGLAVGSTGTPVIAADSLNHELLLIAANASGSVSSWHSLGREAANLITRILPADDRGFLLVGRRGDRGLALLVNRRGELIWTKVETEGSSVMEAATLLRDGRIALAGTAGSGNRNQIVAYLLGVGGEEIIRKMFPGRRPAVAALSNGQVLVVNETIDSPKTLELHSFDESLAEVWTTTVADVSPVPMYLVSPANGGFIVAGQQDGGLLAVKMKFDGAVVSRRSFRRKPAPFEIFENASVVDIGGGLVLAATVLMVDDAYEQRQVIRVINVEALN